jgi:hypothetical protein
MALVMAMVKRPDSFIRLRLFQEEESHSLGEERIQMMLNECGSGEIVLQVRHCGVGIPPELADVAQAIEKLFPFHTGKGGQYGSSFLSFLEWVCNEAFSEAAVRNHFLGLHDERAGLRVDISE